MSNNLQMVLWIVLGALFAALMVLAFLLFKGKKNAQPTPAPDPDSGESDSGESDSGESDSGESDSGESDSGESDSGESDSGAHIEPRFVTLADKTLLTSGEEVVDTLAKQFTRIVSVGGIGGTMNWAVEDELASGRKHKESASWTGVTKFGKPAQPVQMQNPTPVPAPQPATQPAPQPATQPAPQPATQPAPQPATQPAPQPAAQPQKKSTAKPQKKSTANPATPATPATPANP